MAEIPQDWLNGLYGGLLIGLAGAIYLIFNGRIAGVSGISRLSVRSITATCLFMGFAGLTVFIMNHVVGG